jgi:hypothetical protein
MENRLYERPILNSPYECPDRRWELDAEGQPTQEIIPTRRKSSFITPIPKPQKRKAAGQTQLAFDEGKGLSTVDQVYSANEIINQIRDYVTEWRQLPDHEVERHTRNAESAGALAAPPVQQPASVLLPDRGCRDGHLAHGGVSGNPRAVHCRMWPHLQS